MPKVVFHLKIPKESQRYVFVRANQSTNHLIDRGTNGGLADADMNVLVGIDDHGLTGLDMVTGAALLDTQKSPVLESSMNMLILVKAGLFMLLDKCNRSLSSKDSHPMEVWMVQLVTPGKLSW